ncbi:MAG: hypothetical protein E7055_06090 [Lentisphaerae bacterium]|nr:hypothetical protein [Lentisphaerota bacterium]
MENFQLISGNLIPFFLKATAESEIFAIFSEIFIGGSPAPFPAAAVSAFTAAVRLFLFFKNKQTVSNSFIILQIVTMKYVRTEKIDDKMGFSGLQKRLRRGILFGFQFMEEDITSTNRKDGGKNGQELERGTESCKAGVLGKRMGGAL